MQTHTVPSYAAHPLKRFLDEGLVGTINTDDPGISAITFDYELEVAAPQVGLDAGEIQPALRNAVDIAFLDETERQELLNRA